MKALLRIVGLWAAALMLGVVSCGRKDAANDRAAEPAAERSRTEQIREKAKDTFSTAREFFVEQKDAVREKFSDRLSACDRQLAEWKVRMEATGEKARAQWTNTLAQLEPKRRIADEKLRQLKDSTTNTWQKIKAEAEDAFADLEKAFHDAAARFRDGEQSSDPP